MSVLAIVQARLNSTRFKNKALADLCGKPVIAHVIERVETIMGVDDVVLACPRGDAETFQRVLPRTTVLGPKVKDEDVLGRFAVIVETLKPKAVVRITGDCPMIDQAIAAEVIECYRQQPLVDYVSNVCEGYIDGTDVECFCADALMWAHRTATDPYDREHVTSWITRTVPRAKQDRVVPLRSGRKTSIDLPSDLEYVRSLMVMA